MTDDPVAKSATSDPFRPIPDGGLATNLPSWLKDRPAWSTSEQSPVITKPDESVIDPRLLVSEEDFPDWLRAVANREQVQVASDGTQLDPEFDLNVWTGMAARRRVPAMHPEAGDTVVAIESPQPEVREWLDSDDETGTRLRVQDDPILLSLFGAAIVVIVIAVILLAI